jgi:putative peptidoglycan lipid II flippase
VTAAGERGSSLSGAAGTVGIFTLLSRILGFFRDIVIANYFGTRAAADAFFMAFRIPNLLRRLTAEGALSAAFVPLFTKTLIKDRAEAFRLANNVLSHLTLFITLIMILGIVFAEPLLRLIAIGFTDDPQKFQLTVSLTRLVFPYLLFVSLAAILMGILNSLHHFAAPAASPILLNISFILCTIFLRDYFDLPVYALAAGVLIGGVCQLALQIPFAIKKGFTFSFVFDPRSKLLKKVLLLMLPATVGTAVAEINMFVDTMLASLLKEGSVSFLYYANRLVQFPLGVFAIAISTALLPTLSYHAGKNDMPELIGTLSRSLRGAMFLIIPSTAGLIILREPIIELLFERGAFDHAATLNTAYALAFYSMGLLAFSGVKLFVSAFYALGDTKTPVKVAVTAMLINIVLNLLLMGPLQHGGLALATSIASWINLLCLWFLLGKRLGGLDGRRIGKSFLVTGLISLAMTAVIAFLWEPVFAGGFTAGGLALIIFAAVAFYFTACLLSGQPEAREFTKFLKEKLSW